MEAQIAKIYDNSERKQDMGKFDNRCDGQRGIIGLGLKDEGMVRDYVMKVRNERRVHL